MEFLKKLFGGGKTPVQTEVAPENPLVTEVHQATAAPESESIELNNNKTSIAAADDEKSV